MLKVRAEYRVHTLTATFIRIDDLNLGKMSVTNDAEAVVARLAKQYPGRRIFYRDTEGGIDELLHEDGEFIGFAPGQSAYEALVRESK